MKTELEVSHSVHGMKCLEIENASLALHSFLRGVMRCNLMGDPRYEIRKKAAAFLQGGSTEKEGWILIEFWNEKNAEEFVQFIKVYFNEENYIARMEELYGEDWKDFA